MTNPNTIELAGKYICLNHPTAKLALFRHGPADFTAKFIDVDESSILPILATSLSRIPRFCGHTKVHPWSVLHHLVTMAEVYDGLNLVECTALNLFPAPGGYDGMAVLLHDAAEGVLSDIPTPMKNEVDSAKEAAVLRALPWGEAYGHSEITLLLDRTAVIAEATVYGQQTWDWVSEAIDQLSAKYGESVITRLLDRYIDFLKNNDQYRTDVSYFINRFMQLSARYLGNRFLEPSAQDLKYYGIDKEALYAK